MVRFWKKGSFKSWRQAISRNSEYSKRIIKLHMLNPKASLLELRTIKISDILANKPLDSLLSVQKRTRIQAFEVLRLLKRGHTLKYALKAVEINKLDVIQHLGKAIYQKHGKWFARPYDSIQRYMLFFERNAGKIDIVVTNSKDASLIGKYIVAVGKATEDRTQLPLKEFEDKVIIDANGKEHYFETNLDKVYEILEKKERSGFYEIYVSEGEKE